MLQILAIITLGHSIIIPLKETRVPKPIEPYSSLKSPKISLEKALVENYLNFQYSAEFFFGTPPQNLTLTLDTGSSYTWVPTTQCDCHKSVHSYSGSASSSFKNTSKAIDLYYEIGKARGHVVKDTVHMGSISAVGQSFIAVYFDSHLDALTSDGVLGLAFKSLSDELNTFMDNLKAQGVINNAIFSFYLNNFHKTRYMDSVFTIGEYDLALYGNGIEQIIEIDSSSGYWMATGSSLSFGNTKLNRKNFLAIFDLGSSLIAIQDTLYKKYVKLVMGLGKKCYDLGYMVCKCTFGDYTEYPDLKFEIGEQEFVLHAENFIYYQKGYCYLLVRGHKESYAFMGQPFFREYYTVFDMDNNLIRASPAARQGKFNSFTVVEAGIVGISVLGVIGGVLLRNRIRNEDYQRVV